LRVFTNSADGSRNMPAARPARRLLGTVGFAEHSSPLAAAFEPSSAAMGIVKLEVLKLGSEFEIWNH